MSNQGIPGVEKSSTWPIGTRPAFWRIGWSMTRSITTKPKST